MIPAAKSKPVIMVSSTVDGIEDLLEQVFAILSTDYTVWMSYKGTVPVDSTKSNFDNCLEAVCKCDYFLGFSLRAMAAASMARGLRSHIKRCGRH
jgi:hypothetical protein